MGPCRLLHTITVIMMMLSTHSPASPRPIGHHNTAGRAGSLPAPHRVRRSRLPAVTFLAQTGNAPPAVAIAGAGIGGLATAVGLHKLGVPVVVLERAPSLRQEGSAISLWSNAWRGLDALGVSDQLRADTLLLDRIELVSSGGKLLRGFSLSECGTAARAGGGVNETRGVTRPRLLNVLAEQLPPGSIRFNSGVEGVDTSAAGGPVLQLSDGSSLSCKVLVGADGANSRLARQLGLPPPKYVGYTAYRGLAQYAQGSSLPLPLSTIRQMFGRGVRAGMYPLTPSTAYWYVCFNAPEGAPNPANPAAAVAEVLSAVDGWSWGIQQAVRNTDPETISRGRLRDRWTSGSVGKGCVTLIGDALHPMTPNLGQGGCTAIEDGVVLARQLAPVLLTKSGSSSGQDATAAAAEIEACLRSFEAERSRRCLPLTVRSYAFGAALQIPLEPVCALRDLFVEKAFQPSHFLDHTAFDCGTLVQP